MTENIRYLNRIHQFSENDMRDFIVLHRLLEVEMSKSPEEMDLKLIDEIPYPGAPRTSIFEIACSYSWFTCFLEGGLWRLITYQFVHANFGHILFNMWALYFFGPAVENAMTPKRFLAFYLACGVAGALFSSLLAGLNLYTTLPDVPQNELICNQLAAFAGYTGQVQCWEMIPLVGASAAIYGVMVACAFMYPDVHISLLFPPVTLRLRTNGGGWRFLETL